MPLQRETPRRHIHPDRSTTTALSAQQPPQNSASCRELHQKRERNDKADASRAADGNDGHYDARNSMRQQRQYSNSPNAGTQRKESRTNGRAADPPANHWSGDRNRDTGYREPDAGTHDDVSATRPRRLTLAHAPTDPADTANPAPPIGTHCNRDSGGEPADQHTNAQRNP